MKDVVDETINESFHSKCPKRCSISNGCCIRIEFPDHDVIIIHSIIYTDP